MHLLDCHQFLILGLLVTCPATSAAAMPRVTPFLDLHHRDLQEKIRVGEDIGEVDQFIKEVENCAPFGAHSPLNHTPSLFVLLDQISLGHNGFDHQHTMIFQKTSDFVTNRGHRPMLDLDQSVVRTTSILKSPTRTSSSLPHPRRLPSVAGAMKFP